VLAVSAQMPLDALAQQFVNKAKVGPSERLADLVRGHLPGIPMQSMPVPPRQIPFNAGFVYYEIAQGGPLWDMVMKHGGIGLHVAGEFRRS
jgi:type VI secretion system protein ImpJ